MSQNRLLEICIDNFDSALKAALGGADRLEICSSLAEGGLTPSVGLVSLIVEEIRDMPAIQVYAMIRCKSGSDFVYSDSDVRVMISDIRAFKGIGVDGFVFGALRPDGSVDVPVCRRIVEAAAPKPVTFHRAFDVCASPEDALETIVEVGFRRILTSGGAPCAASDEALPLLKKIISQAGDRIVIMPGGGIRPENVQRVLEAGATEVHASCLVPRGKLDSKLEMGTTNSGIIYTIDQSRVQAVSSIVKSFKS